MTQNQKKNGTVYLVGAGPGDPGLITLAGIRRLREADVVIYDALMNPLLLDEVRDGAECIDAGKRGGDHTLTQDETNALIVEKAKQGLNVVRIKGGDPYLFGRGAEELSYLAKHGVRGEMIPGVTSGIAAPAMAGIPVTHRRFASTITFVTGHEDPSKTDTAVDYRALAKLILAGGTVCFYMGIKKLPIICETLIGRGLELDTPVAVVQWGTLPKQRALRSTIGRVAHDVVEQGMAPPAITVIGQVAAIDEPGLDFFMDRPLFGRRIVITRTRLQASTLKQKLGELGAAVLEAPTIRLAEPDDWKPVDDALRDVQQYDWLVLTSAKGVEAVAQRLKILKLDVRHLHSVRIAAIGDATAEALTQHLSITPDLVPTEFVGESLAADLIAKHGVDGKRMLLLRADIARPALPKLLKEAGAQVTEVEAYQTKLADSLPDNVRQAIREGEVDWITFTSSSTAENLATLLGDDKLDTDQIKIASIGKITSEAIRKLGWPVAVEATTSNIPGLVEALIEAEQS